MKSSEMPKLIKQKYLKYVFKDLNGEYSEFFWGATAYQDGFSSVVTRPNGASFQRDLLGRLSFEKTISGKEFYKFFIEEIPLKKINIICFADIKFCEGVKDELILREKDKATEAFKLGKKVSKSRVQKKSEKDFNYIDKMHKKALTIKKTKINARKRPIISIGKIQHDYSLNYNETIDYLNKL